MSEARVDMRDNDDSPCIACISNTRVSLVLLMSHFLAMIITPCCTKRRAPPKQNHWALFFQVAKTWCLKECRSRKKTVFDLPGQTFFDKYLELLWCFTSIGAPVLFFCLLNFVFFEFLPFLWNTLLLCPLFPLGNCKIKISPLRNRL